MKLLSTFLIVSLTLIGFGSFSSISDIEPIPKLTLVAANGENRVIDLADMKISDWQDEIAFVEFCQGEELVVMTGILVYAPIDGDAIIVTFNDGESLTKAFIHAQETFKHSFNDRIILDNLKSAETKKHFSPLLYTVRD